MPLMDTNCKISAPWGDIAQALPHTPEVVQSLRRGTKALWKSLHSLDGLNSNPTYVCPSAKPRPCTDVRQ
ncbi:unnamed protein product [Boreogadus saida]